MMIDPTRVSLRPGSTGEFLNIDYDGREIGYLTFDGGGRLVGSWAIHYPDRPLVDSVARATVHSRPRQLGEK